VGVREKRRERRGEREDDEGGQLVERGKAR